MARRIVKRNNTIDATMAAHPQASRPDRGEDRNPLFPDFRGQVELPTVQLRHELPDRTWHVDWLIARDPAGSQPLVTFRLTRRLETLATGQAMDIQRIADHRPAYLEFEGPVSGGRGEVTRLARGLLSVESLAEGWKLEVRWDPGDSQPQADVARHYELMSKTHDFWRVVRVDAVNAPSGDAGR